MCSLSQDCLPQPGTSQLLDAISDRVMQPLSYRNFGDHEAWTLDHTVNVSTTGRSQAGVRWYEIDRPIVGGSSAGQPYTLAQQGNYAPDGNNRWMGSVAMNGNGDMALGYSIGSGSMDPSIAFTGRTKCDPAGQMTVPEGMIEVGSGVQTGYNRWGDYTDMSVDPTDDTTFWYVDEYYATTSAEGWQTRIGSFKVPTCGTDATPPTVSWTSPANSADVHGTVTLSANATDDTSVTSVVFAANSTPIATVTTGNGGSYQTSWSTTTGYADGSQVTLTATATDSAGLQTTATETVTVDNSLPTVSLTPPPAVVTGSVNLTATAGDVGSAITGVDFLVDGTVVGSSGSPFGTTWNSATVGNGSHTLAARAYDGAGNFTTSAGVVVTVDNTAPTVAFTAPASNAFVRGVVTLTATATDDSSVTSVVFKANGVIVATVSGSASPYSTSWTTTGGAYADGTKVTLTATATDLAGLSSTATETVTVDNSLPSVSITAPTAGATVSGSVPLTVTTSDAGSPVAKIEYLVDGNVVATSTTSPFGVMWNLSLIHI